jgi:hypothetical protein
MYKNPLYNSLCYYPERSSLEEERQELKKINEESEILKEHILLDTINRLPQDIKQYIATFSPIILTLRKQVKHDFFENWITENVKRIFGILETWPKRHIGFVLNGILCLNHPDCNMYLKGDHLYQHWTASHMTSLIILEISNRSKTRDRRICELVHYKYQHIHKFIPCITNPELNELSPIRIWGAYKAIEEYERRLKMNSNVKTKANRSKRSRQIVFQ